MSKPLLCVTNLFCERDERILFDRLTFTLNTGNVLQVEGCNGSGKTTLLRIISGLSSQYEGDLLWQGTAIEDIRDEYLANLLYFGHQPGVKGALTPRENLRWYCALHPALDASKIETALSAVGLRRYEDVPCHSLSAGQNRRVSLARLYMNNACLWVLDEPFTAIDKAGVAAMEQLLIEHAHRGGGVIVTTHHDLAASKVVKVNLDRCK